MEITLGGPGFSAQPCTSFSGQYCEFPAPEAPNVPDGLGTFTITCKALDWFDWENGVPHFKYDTDSVPIVIDSVPPAITITQAPPDGSTLPYTSFRVEGTIDDASPVVLFQTESGIQISTNGSQWFVDITTAGAVGNPPTTVGIPLSGRMDFSVKATDIVGNLIAVSTESQFITNPMWVADPTMAHHWYFDGLPPTVDFSSSSIGSLKQITSIRGTASDNYKLDRVQLNIKENSTGRYWNGTQFAAGIATITIPLPQVKDAPWEYTGLDPDQMQTDSSHTITLTAYDALQGATVIEAGLTLATAFLGEGVVADMFDGSLVQFLGVPAAPHMNMGRIIDVCVHYPNPKLKNLIRFEEYPKRSVIVSPTSRPDSRCAAPDENITILSVIPTESNQNPPIVTGCNESSEIRAFIGSQIVGRLKFDIITPKIESSEILAFRNDYAIPQQVTGFRKMTDVECDIANSSPKKYCIGYLHAVFFEGNDNNRPLLPNAPGARPWIVEKITDVPNQKDACNSGPTTTRNGPATYDSATNRFMLNDFNGYTSTTDPKTRNLQFNCTDRATQEIFFGKCRFGPISLVQKGRTINGVRRFFMDRSDHDNTTAPYPPSPP